MVGRQNSSAPISVGQKSGYLKLHKSLKISLINLKFLAIGFTVRLSSKKERTFIMTKYTVELSKEDLELIRDCHLKNPSIIKALDAAKEQAAK
ncbi:hypothetical protein LEQ_0477c [Ligilactobacillus equi DPC 6820]|uniref:Uncharacterized protein n=1 Tax=Ligilactobacillus equi DPC 6820 TaxID=1392007 RepID=V7HWY7_9LACO|nr:hypothetical protein LEQ_0477c [Ligilactobacillus equi DPC 6820]